MTRHILVARPSGALKCVQFRSRRNCQLLPGARWLELLLQHVPDKDQHLVRYYGYYSNRARGDRARPEAALMQALREAVLNLLQERECITAEFAERLLAWRHSGFSVHNRVRVKAADGQGRKQLARYMIRAPFALGKMRYDAATGMIVYRSKMHATFKRNFQLVPGARWLELLLQHVPDKNEHLVRYYGYYSNRSRGDRARREAAAEHSCAPHSGSLAIVENRATTRTARASWARLIKQVYESDPLTCPRCASDMRVIALIDDESIIRRIASLAP